jgi:membrane protein YqaA with SNARE-associated domain
MTELIGLFTAAFLSASFFPFQSELIFIGMLIAEHHADWVILVVASLGNTLGSVLNWWLGRGVAHFKNKHWFPIKHAALERAKRWFQRWGKWSLLLSWVPIVGDPLTMIAGVLRMHFLPFIVIVAIAKTGRYLAIMAAM